MSYTAAAAGQYLAAMIDGEGTVSKPHARQRAVRVTNTDYDIISACVECCDALGVTCRVYKRAGKRCHGKQAWDVAVYGRGNFEKLSKLPLRSSSKKARLCSLVLSYRRPLKPSITVLESLLRAGETLEAVGRLFGVTVRTVRYWLKAV